MLRYRRWQLDIGYWLLVIGNWILVDIKNELEKSNSFFIPLPLASRLSPLAFRL